MSVSKDGDYMASLGAVLVAAFVVKAFFFCSDGRRLENVVF